jgi:phosphoglycerate kinase
MAYTFMLAQGKKVGDSLSEPEKINVAKEALENAEKKSVKFLLPTDHVVVDHLNFKEKTIGNKQVVSGNIPEGQQGVDIGPETLKAYQKEIAAAKTIFWNGPMGVFEIRECAAGTFEVAKAVAANENAKSIIGGGDSVKAVKQAGLAEKITFISTGGGASLEFVEGKLMPGVAALNDK